MLLLDRKVALYHAHVYFQAETRVSAVALRDQLAELFGAKIALHSLSDGPRGPHINRMFGIDIPNSEFEGVVAFLLIHHGVHTVLFHPVTGNELLDHTHHGLWLGGIQPLDLAVLV